MPITSVPSTDGEKQQRLAILVNEAKRRGLEVPKVSRQIYFPVDSSGYFPKNDGKLFRPTNDDAVKFIESNAAFCALISGRGGGKSCAGAQKALRKIAQGYSGTVLNADFENFKISTWPEFREWIPWELVVPRQRYRNDPGWEPYQPFTLTFMNGARVLCKGLKDPDSARGPNVNWLWYDEAGRDSDGLAWQIAIASVRVGENIQAWITTTPKGKAHWIYRFFVLQDIPEDARIAFEELGLDREFIEMFETTVYKNKENLDPIFFASILAAYPKGWLRDQEVYGKFVDSGGALGDRMWFSGKIVPSVPTLVTGRVRYWDLAGTEKKMIPKKGMNDPDETVGTKLSWVKGSFNPQDKSIGTFCIENQVSGFWKWDDMKKAIAITAVADGPHVKIFLEQEPASGGKNQVAALQEYLMSELGPSYKVYGYRPNNDRVLDANTWFAEAASGQFYMVYGNWNEGFLDQLDTFGEPNTHDDKITSVTGARFCLAPIRKWNTMKFLHIGMKVD